MSVPSAAESAAQSAAQSAYRSKVPVATAAFWAIKVLATTLGETAGDTLSMSFNFGYLVATAVFASLLVVLVAWQVAATRFHAALYWSTIIASTTAGTTMADYATRSMGIGYAGGSALLFALVLLSLALWRLHVGVVASDRVSGRLAETYYWVTITFSQTLGTALGDWLADTRGLGYLGAATVFAAMLLLVLGLYLRTRLNRIALFWAAFVLTRPLGAAVGDFLDKPLADGGLALSRPLASIVLMGAMVLLIYWFAARDRAAKG